MELNQNPAGQKPNGENAAPSAPRKEDTPGAAQQIVMNLQRGRNEITPPKAGEKLPWRVTYNAAGQLLYRIGLQTEYDFVRLGRFLRAAWRIIRHLAGALIRFIAGPLVLLFSGIWADLTAPFRRFASGIRHMHEAARAETEAGGSGRRAGLEYFASGVRAYRHLVSGALKYLMPLGALCIFVFTVSEVLNSSFSLGVSYHGDFLVFIENETVWDSAEKLVQERVVASEGAKVEWDNHPEFELRIVDPAARTNVSELADKIVAASSDQIMKAVGIRVNGQLIGMVEDGRAVQQLLDDRLAQYDDGTHDSVGFLYPIEQIPGVYFTNSVQDSTMLLQALEASDLLSVKVMDRIEYNETVEYTTETVESDEYYRGVRFVSQRGRSGTQHVIAEQTSVNGTVIDVKPVEIQPVEEMIPRIVTVGTKEPVYSSITAEGGAVVGSGSMVFPVPQMTYVTTRFGQGRPPHRGIDLCAPAGTPVLAVDAGVVVESGSHWSWGNYVLIDHGNGYTTRYAHCTALNVSAGMPVAAGQQIGTIGRTGFASGNHLHFELTLNGRLIDPAPYLGV